VGTEAGPFRVAVVQVPPVVLDREATLARAVGTAEQSVMAFVGGLK